MKQPMTVLIAAPTNKPVTCANHTNTIKRFGFALIYKLFEEITVMKYPYRSLFEFMRVIANSQMYQR